MAPTVSPGDRVRIVAGPWSSDCGMVVKVTKAVIRVRVDTGGKVVIVSPKHVETISNGDGQQ